MSQTAAPDQPKVGRYAAAVAPTTPLQKHHFLLRRLHSLTGILPVGVFVCFHLFTNFQMVFGTFQHEVEWIHSLPALLITEVFGLWLPIAFHAALGLAYTFGGLPNTRTYKYGDNWRYTLQRTTGMLALIFIFFHIATLRWGWTFFGLIDTPFVVTGPHGSQLALASTAMAFQGESTGHLVAVTSLYVIGVYSVVYHWANGLWTAAITWGLTVSVASQKRWGAVCLGLGLTLAVFSAGAIWKGVTYDVSPVEKDAVHAAVLEMRSPHAVVAPTIAPADVLTPAASRQIQQERTTEAYGEPTPLRPAEPAPKAPAPTTENP
ncbi:MAG: hypothetical protein NTW19_03780 [Planctomycetota bacterium]|nr:hypothetical protein [Planctomycetota bacterium]